MKQRSQAGVTLLELLIAVTLVSLIAVAVLMAMRVGVNAMEKANSRLLSNRRVTGTQSIMERQIGSLMAVKANCQANPAMGPVERPFFQGAPETLRFVSAYSLREAFRGYPRILEYQVIPGEDNRGVRLVVNELLYSGSASTGMLCFGNNNGFLPVEVGPQSFVLADQLAFCRISYLGQPEDGPPRAQWLPVWRRRELPLAIRIEMAPLEPDAGRLPLTTLTVPVRVNKDPMKPVLDEYAFWR